MRIFNETKTNEIENPDLENGKLILDKIFIEQEAGEKVPITYFTDGTEKYGRYEYIYVYIPYTYEELKEIRDKKRHLELKEELEKIKEDIEQEVFGIVRDDYEEKKARAATIVNELRILEGKSIRDIKY